MLHRATNGETFVTDCVTVVWREVSHKQVHSLELYLFLFCRLVRGDSVRLLAVEVYMK